MNRPQQSREVTERLLRERGVLDVACLVGERGYFLNTMGEPGENDRDIYDDAIFLITPTCFMSWNANVDPSPYQTGVASLVPGVYTFALDVHGKSKPKSLQYPCLQQYGDVTVRRDGPNGGTLDKGDFAIQIHRGSYDSTSSLGCQTIPPDQWCSFMPIVVEQMKRHGLNNKIKYVLLDHQG
jgi:lysozyme